MNNALPDLPAWSRALRGLAARSARWPGPAPTADPRGVETPFSLWRAKRGAGAERPQNPGPDARLWWMVAGDEGDAGAFIDSLAEQRRSTDRGSLFPQGLYRTIEVWTESELASLHALWWLGRGASGTRSSDARARMLDAARWHLDNTQPDNATNRPWAAQVFLELSVLDLNPDARLYAETLLHNATAANGVPEPFSAAILLDAADAIDAMSENA